MPKVRRNKTKPPPDGWELIEPTLTELAAKMREAENESHEGKRKVGSLWPIFRLHHQRSRYIYEIYFKRHQISKELYEYCLDQGYGDANLIAKWKKTGYEKLCCLRCIQQKDTNFGTTCICRVPKEKLEENRIVECLHCGCRGSPSLPFVVTIHGNLVVNKICIVRTFAAEAHRHRIPRPDDHAPPIDADTPPPLLTSLHTDDIAALRSQPRAPCPQCSGSYKTYCPVCCIPLQHVPTPVSLPISVDIWRHTGERSTKSTSPHLVMLARPHVAMHTDGFTHRLGFVRDEPDQAWIDDTLLLFPSDNALPLADIPQASFKRLIVIDGTWRQARTMSRHPSFEKFRRVKIQERETLFWRWQTYSSNYLSTIEAIYYFFRDYYAAYESLRRDGSIAAYDGRYDNLLLYFKLQYETVQNAYHAVPGKQFNKIKDYIVDNK
ncbi:hypothetical protein SeMB42_g05590 [Synchytrium endobioticum]|uniref:tRNA-uridine aminocarboxypropyltransferase n=1 Tax=Synchytrium endobioticum TaxID=286115 RepID=A0A507CQG9_9FUNG|nr:hypothetical protein SeMB42_g05590 [Synchytrium endobioticum]